MAYLSGEEEVRIKFNLIEDIEQSTFLTQKFPNRIVTSVYEVKPHGLDLSNFLFLKQYKLISQLKNRHQN